MHYLKRECDEKFHYSFVFESGVINLENGMCLRCGIVKKLWDERNELRLSLVCVTWRQTASRLLEI